jgi:asparagine synthase (glutamine-hydrolysing)
MAIPQSVKVPAFRTKDLLKRAVEGIIPQEIIARPKQGFAVPVIEWFQQKLGDQVRSTLRSFSRSHPYFNESEVERLLLNTNSQLPWYLFNFALWHETWIEQKVSDGLAQHTRA